MLVSESIQVSIHRRRISKEDIQAELRPPESTNMLSRTHVILAVAGVLLLGACLTTGATWSFHKMSKSVCLVECSTVLSASRVPTKCPRFATSLFRLCTSRSEAAWEIIARLNQIFDESPMPISTLVSAHTRISSKSQCT